LRGSDLGAMHDGAEGDDADVAAFFHHPGFAERHGIVSAGIFGAIVRLAVKMLMLQEHHGIIAPHCGAQKSGDIKRGGRHDHAQAGQCVKMDSPLWL